MGIMDSNYKRLALLITIFIFLLCMYTAQAFLINKQYDNYADVNTFTDDIETGYGADYENKTATGENIEQGGVDLFGILQFITFTSDGLSDWIKVILAPIGTIMLIISIYLAIDITYDIIKALPFT